MLSSLQSQQRGLTLVELLIGLAIGLVMVSVMVLAYLSNMATTRSMVASSSLDERARFAFEYLARDVREAGSLPCGLQTPVANVLNSAPANGGSDLWADFEQDLQGYAGDESIDFLAAFAGGYGARVSGTDAFTLSVNSGTHFSVAQHNTASAQFKLNEASHDLQAGDIVLVCDYAQSAIFQITNANSANSTVVHNTGASTPGNCTKGLGSPVVCSTNGTPHSFAQNGVLAKVNTATWYVGCNQRADCSTAAGRSLFFTYLDGGTLVTQDLIDGVVDFQVGYLARTGNAYQAADTVANWSNVIGIDVSLTLEEASVGVGTNNRDIQRSFDFAMAVRSKL